MGSLKQRPLMLKDYLKEDQNLDTIDGFRLTHHRHGRTKPTGFRRSLSKGINLTRVSTFLKMLATASPVPRPGLLQRSFSKKLLAKSFWKKRTTHRRDVMSVDCVRSPVMLKDAIRLESLADWKSGGKVVFSPLRPSTTLANGCSCSSSVWSENDWSSGTDSVLSMSSPLPEFTAKLDSLPEQTRTDKLLSSVDQIQKRESDCGTCHDYEEKEQLSPVSVMEFPYEEEDTSASAEASPDFQQSLASIERTKQELLNKIRRFESLARLVDAVDLDEAFSEEQDEDLVQYEETDGGGYEIEEHVCARAREMLERFTLSCSAGTLEPDSEDLFLDFFYQGLCDCWGTDRTVEEGLLVAAREWTDGIFREGWESREALMRELDVNGRWRCVNEVDVDVCADLEMQMFGSLLDDLVVDIFLD